jgi:hypothetical protein
LFEVLSLAVGGPDQPGGRVSPQQSDFLWQLVQEAQQAFSAGRFQEDHLKGVMLLGIGQKDSADWPRIAVNLPANLRGPIAYVLGRCFRIHLGRPDDARAFFEDAAKHAAKAVSPALLQSFLDAESLHRQRSSARRRAGEGLAGAPS